MAVEAYTGFAEVYDLFMDNVPYGQWHENLTKILQQHGIRDGLVLDLGCGTGKMTELFRQAGYDMIGVDLSADMLQIAMEKQADSGEILYLCQDMREFELYGTVRAVYSICDSMNYIMSEEELLQVFGLVNNYLDPGGLFLFDMNTPYKYETLLGENTICENRAEGSFIWENYYDKDSAVNEYGMTFYVREKTGDEADEPAEEAASRRNKEAAETDELYRRYEEVHYQRAYRKETVIALLEQAGLLVETVCDADTGGELETDSERMLFVAREHEKNSAGQ